MSARATPCNRHGIPMCISPNATADVTISEKLLREIIYVKPGGMTCDPTTIENECCGDVVTFDDSKLTWLHVHKGEYGVFATNCETTAEVLANLRDRGVVHIKRIDLVEDAYPN